MAVIVYDHPLSPYAQKVKIALLEKGVSFEALLPEGIGSGELAARMKSRAADQIARWQGWLTARLGDRPWFNGDKFGWGDLAVVSILSGSRGFSLTPDPDSRLGRWLARANERERVISVTEVASRMQMGGSDEARAGLAAVRERMERGEFKREYRDHQLEWMIKTGGFDVVREGLEKDNIRFTDEFTA